MNQLQLTFTGDISGLGIGIEIFAAELGFDSATANGLPVYVKQEAGSPIRVSCKDCRAEIAFSEKIHFFRALGLLVEALREKQEFEIKEVPPFKTNGAMFDVSQGNAVTTVDNVKNILLRMSLMGLNMLMIYTEDNYKVEGEPYFGYMRGRYTQEELKQCDDYADIFGIEMIPCIQTLAHLIDALRWNRFADMKEDDDTLLVGCEEAYEFIEKMIVTASSPFRTKRIHIGMDEAWKLGQGRYLLLNGYKRKLDIMTEHLARVHEIVKKHGLKPMIWSDMYFRAASSNENEYYEMESYIPQDILDLVPKDMQFVYWDYEHHDESFYVEWIKRHRELGSDPLFAGGIWTWNGFGADYKKTFVTTNAALAACKKTGISEVFVTIWGDGGTESSIYENLLGMQLFAEHGYCQELDQEKLVSRFKFCTGGNFDDFYNLTYVDSLPGMETKEGYFTANGSKYLLYQDPMMGLFDKNIEGNDWSKHFHDLHQRMEAAEKTNGAYGFVFELMAKLCSVLELKADLGLRLAAAYREGNKDVLAQIAAAELPELSRRLEALRLCHHKQWMETNKPFGWEVLDIRYGGLAARIHSTASRLKDYLEGRVSCLEELEAERLLFNGVPGMVFCCPYRLIPSASRLSI
jgi:hexosaminidase